MPEPKKRLLETALIDELSNIDRQIAALKDERNSVERLLLKIRKENIGGKDVTRKNSTGRILVENTILDRISRSGNRGADALVLLNEARQMIPKLNEITFRSHLRRMRLRNLIYKDKGGKWHLNPEVEKPI